MSHDDSLEIVTHPKVTKEYQEYSFWCPSNILPSSFCSWFVEYSWFNDFPNFASFRFIFDCRIKSNLFFVHHDRSAKLSSLPAIWNVVFGYSIISFQVHSFLLHTSSDFHDMNLVDSFNYFFIKLFSPSLSMIIMKGSFLFKFFFFTLDVFQPSNIVVLLREPVLIYCLSSVYQCHKIVIF